MGRTSEPGNSISEAAPEDEPKDTEVQTKVEELDDIDPSLAEWFKIDKGARPEAGKENDSDSATDDDSDNADVAEADEDDLDDWFEVKPAAAPTTAVQEDLSQVSVPPFILAPCLMNWEQGNMQDIKMGETETAMEYDENLIFRHLCVPERYRLRLG